MLVSGNVWDGSATADCRSHLLNHREAVIMMMSPFTLSPRSDNTLRTTVIAKQRLETWNRPGYARRDTK